MKFKNILLAAFVASFVFASSATASTEIDYDRDNQVLTVTTDDYFNHDSQVSILMYKTSELGAGTISGLSLDEFRAISPYFYEKKADSNGVAEFNIPLTANMRENGGDYTVKLASKAMISMPYMNCELYSDTELTSAFNNLLSYIDNNNLSKHLEDESFCKVLGLDEIYNNVQDKSIVSVSLAKYKNLNGISSFSDIKKAESYIDDGEQYHAGMMIDGYPFLGGHEWILDHKDEVFCTCTIGCAKIKAAIQRELTGQGVRFATIIATGVYVAPCSVIGPGSVIYGGTTISVNCKIGAGVVFNDGVSIGHDVTIGDYTSIMPGTGISGGCTIGKEVDIGGHAYIVPGRKVGDGARIAAGSIVFTNVQLALMFLMPQWPRSV